MDRRLRTSGLRPLFHPRKLLGGWERSLLWWWAEKARSARKAVAALVAATSLLLLAGCAARRPQPDILDAETLIQEGRQRGLEMEIPFAISPQIQEEVEKNVGFGTTAVERLRRIVRYLNDKGYINFHYEPDMSLTATEAFDARRGDCMAYTNLYLGIARYLKVPVYFVHVSEARNYYVRDGLFFVSSHMAVGYGTGAAGFGSGPYTVVIDFTQEASDWRLMLYQSIDDATAVGLYYNNVAVDRMMAGDLAGAEKLWEFLIEKLPELKEVYNNLGVLYLRQGDYEKAQVLLQNAIERFPYYQPLYTNAIQAARGSRNPELAKELEARGKKLLSRDPFYRFNQGVALFNGHRYPEAIEEFARALKSQPKNPYLHAWLARTYLSAGETARGIKAFEEAQSLSPNLHMLKSLREEFSVLGQVPEPPIPLTP
jgi:tetratricopeptide (TPR) repeat protein